MRIVLGVTGGIAAYKATELIRGFKALGQDVVVVPTPNALRFIGAPTLEALSGNPVSAELYENVDSVQHVAIGQSADLVVVAPATASFLARYAAGFADDLLGNTLLATAAPVIVAPAMHTEMWHHQATQDNLQLLKARGVHVVEPAVGALTSGDVGVGRLPDAEVIISQALAVVAPQDLRGVRLLVTAGGTRAPIDPVRFLGNNSSGKQGLAIAQAARARGAQVTVIAANLDSVSGDGCIPVSTNQELESALQREIVDTDVLIMAAAVADYSIDRYSQEKIKRTGEHLSLTFSPAEDLLAKYSRFQNASGNEVFTVGFAAESIADGALVDAALEKLRRKNCNLVVANDISGGAIFGSDSTSITVVGPSGVIATGEGPKLQAANVILDAIVAGLERHV